jgi:hypothetical protein
MWARTCWRGGIAGLTCYDEVFDPVLVADALAHCNYDSALILGPDWCDIDPALCGEVIARHRENPSALPFTFTQAPPGVAGCVIGLELTKKLAAGREAGDPTATLGGLLGFKPTRPRRDPIAESCCVQVSAELRSIQRRFIADAACESPVSPSEELAQPTQVGTDASGGRKLTSENGGSSWLNASAPSHLIVEVTTARRALEPDASRLNVADAARLFKNFASTNPQGVLTLFGRGDPLLHPELPAIIRAARDARIPGIHLRTDATADEAAIEALLAASPDVISVDLYATTEPTYSALTQTPHFSRALVNTQRLLDGRRFVRGLPHPWIVPRITRRDAVYEEVEGFYDRALFFACAGVIDPMPRPIAGERIAPLPKPRGTVERDAGSRMFIRCDGLVIADETDIDAKQHEPVGNALMEGIAPVWSRLMERRRAALRDHGHAHPDLRTMP